QAPMDRQGEGVNTEGLQPLEEFAMESGYTYHQWRGAGKEPLQRWVVVTSHGRYDLDLFRKDVVIRHADDPFTGPYCEEALGDRRG
ncbi:MAG: hypothetical protein PHE57_05070, partial [Synergistales bacterium]|nr:hypothetical protein [Synergistales bacterium]